MKTLIIILSVLVSTSLFAQKDKEHTKDVPSAVTAAFVKQFPNVKDVDWEKEGKNYEAEFEVGEAETSATFTADGTLLETETEIEVSALPNTAQQYISQHYSGYTIKEAARITDHKGVVTYEAEVKKKGESMDVIFSENGAFVKVIEY